MPEIQTQRIVQSKLNIDLAALGHNYHYFNSICGGKAAAVVKANGYGLGAIRCANALYENGARAFFVAHLREAIELRNAINNDAQIYVLNGFFEHEIDYYQKYNIVPVINNLEQLQIIKPNAKKLNPAIHIDTGMNRLGLSQKEFESNIDIIKSVAPSLVISHLACASNKSHPLNETQLERFVEIKSYLPNSKFSLAASAGTILGPEYHFDLPRIGIGLYGSNPIEQLKSPLKPVANLTAPIIQIRKVKAGETIGYSATYCAKSDLNIGVVALGYADGFLRSASNSGFGVFNGSKCQILGRVSMDLIAIDISKCDPMPEIGAQIEFLGENANIDEQAMAMNTIAYEILTRLGSRFEVSESRFDG